MSGQEGRGCNLPALLVLLWICLQKVISDDDISPFTAEDLYRLSQVKLSLFVKSNFLSFSAQLFVSPANNIKIDLKVLNHK